MGLSPLGVGLNLAAEGHHSNAPIKTFIIERVASLILASNDSWNIRAYNPLSLPLAPTLISKELTGLIQLDALKIAYAQTKREEYLNLFINIRNLISKKINNGLS
jgi:predicted methyltransferase